MTFIQNLTWIQIYNMYRTIFLPILGASFAWDIVAAIRRGYRALGEVTDEEAEERIRYFKGY